METRPSSPSAWPDLNVIADNERDGIEDSSRETEFEIQAKVRGEQPEVEGEDRQR